MVLVAFPSLLTPKTAPAKEAAKKKRKLCKIGYVLAGMAALHFSPILAEPHGGQ
jgi:hypothetical protein